MASTIARMLRRETLFEVRRFGSELCPSFSACKRRFSRALSIESSETEYTVISARQGGRRSREIEGWR